MIQAIRPKVTEYAKYHFVAGTVVGLECIRDQHIRGRGHFSGGQVFFGDYTGRQAGRPGHGAIHGSGSISGFSEQWTEYHCMTRFFLRDSRGRDYPITIPGDDFRVLEEHCVAAVVASNVEGEIRTLVVFNTNTRQRYDLVSEDELIAFLDIPRYRTVRVLLRSPEKRLDELRKYRRYVEATYPWLLITMLLGFGFAFIGWVIGTRNVVMGNVLIATGLIATVLATLSLIIVWVGQYVIDAQPSFKEVQRDNPEVDEELNDYEEYLRRVINLLALP